MKNLKMKSVLLTTAALIVAAAAFTTSGSIAGTDNGNGNGGVNNGNQNGKNAAVDPNKLKTAYPIKHLVVIFQENVSFDHYFGTYPMATNPPLEPAFHAAANTPSGINNLTGTLLTNNPNFTNAANSPYQQNPFRLDRTQAATGDQGHSYTPEQKAYDAGKNDLFPINVGNGTSGGSGAFGTKALVMGYFDGNTVTALWNYAQNYAMSDNSWSDQFGPSTPGALNMFAGQTNGMVYGVGTSSAIISDGTLTGGLTLINDVDPTFDVCSPSTSASINAPNIGDLLNAADIPWGSFMGGFDLHGNGVAGCTHASGVPITGVPTADYIQHHAWFQYFKSTSNATHARPTSTAAVGYTIVPGTEAIDPANHAYDLHDFYDSVNAGNYPAVSFVKMPAFQDGHAGYSNPLDEQTGVVTLINFLQQLPDWNTTAVIIAYDDSDGWYDHAFATTTHGSFNNPADALNGTGNCGTPGVTLKPVGVNGQPVDGRCGPGTRQPFLVISPYAKQNYVSHVLTTQASITQFVEDNWLNGQRLGKGSFDVTTGSIVDMFDFKQKNSMQLILDPALGTVSSATTIKN